jgi:biotin carboxylase
LDDYHLKQFRTIRNNERYAFHNLLDCYEITYADEFPMEKFMAQARTRLDSFDGSVDGIVGYWDFPTSVLKAMLRREYGLTSPSLESILRCEHKYWARLIQKRVVPEMVPEFRAVDPYDAESVAAIDLLYPYWLKPVKSHSSYLGFKIHSRAELDRAITMIRQGIHRFGDPLNYAMERAKVPPEIAQVDGYHCIAEALISAGRQCTLEGYIHDGEVTIYGTIDSIRDRKHRSTFARYEYPSRLPPAVKQRMADAARKVVRETGLDNAPFNIEFYYNKPQDRISLLEINARISKSHIPLFKLVDGASHQQVMVQLAAGERPDFPDNEGPHHAAAKFMYRRYRDAVVTRVPTAEEIEELETLAAGTDIQIEVREGDRLSEMPYQDSYSYEVAVIFTGGPSHDALLRRYRRLLEALQLRFDVSGHGDGRKSAEARVRT